MPDITIPRNFLWLLAEFGNILPWNAETTGGTTSDGNPLVNVQWHDDKHEVCFLDYRDEVLTVGFNGDCIDDYRVQYFALSGLAKTYDAEWCDFDEPAAPPASQHAKARQFARKLREQEALTEDE